MKKRESNKEEEENLINPAVGRGLPPHRSEKQFDGASIYSSIDEVQSQTTDPEP